MELNRRHILAAMPLVLAPRMLLGKEPPMPTTSLTELRATTEALRASYIAGAPRSNVLAQLQHVYMGASSHATSAFGKADRHEAREVAGWTALLCSSVLSDGRQQQRAREWANKAQVHAGDDNEALVCHALMRRAIVELRAGRGGMNALQFADQAEYVASDQLRDSHPDTYARSLALLVEVYGSIWAAPQHDDMRRQLEAMIDRLPVSASHENPWAFTRAHAYQALARGSNHLMRPEALKDSDQALATYPPGEVMLIRITQLTKAQTLARLGRPDQAVDLALSVLQQCPPVGPGAGPEECYVRCGHAVINALPGNYDSQARSVLVDLVTV